MAVTLSLFAGAGAQFFDNNGNPLTGGKIYTYNAGTTTPLATYTTNSDASFHTNPIVLDSAGRVPSGGEIWLQLGVGYKFVLQTAANVLIATYDNIPSSAQPPAANDADSIMYEQGYTVTAGSFVVGKIYRIVSIGTTNFTLIGATANSVGLHFIATGVGSGTGTAELSQTVETKLRETVSVKDFGAVGDGIADDTVAFSSAIAASKQIYIPAGTYLVDTVVVTGNGYNIVGASPTDTIIRARTSSTTKLFDVHGVPFVGYSRENTFRNFTLDMQNMTDTSSSYGLYLNYAYNLSFEQIKVINNGTSKLSLYAESTGGGRGVYTTVFTNCDFSSVTGIVKLTGVSLSDAITTFTFTGCAFGACNASNCVAITFLQPIVQGALNKFTLANISGFSVIGGDIEGTGTAYVLGSNVNQFASINNTFSGFSGTFSTGTFSGGYFLDSYGSKPFSFNTVNNQPTLHQNSTITETASNAAFLRKLIENTNVASQVVDVQTKNVNGSSYFGQNAAGDAYIDNRASGKTTLQQSGTDRLGVTATQLMMIGTLTSATAGALAGYIRFVNNSGVEYKIPYYNV